MRLLWLPDVLRAAGLTVREVPGWQTRSGAEDPDASTYRPQGLMAHETRAVRIASDADELRILIDGRPGLSGPIAPTYVGRDGTWHVVAAGLCHHVRTGWAGPFEGLGNPRLFGVEAAHTVAVDGSGRRLETWAQKPAQYASYVRGVAAILRHTGWPPPGGHKEHQPGDKSDPEFDMARFRADVARVLAGGSDDMEQTDDLAYKTPHNPARKVGHVFTDISNLRDALIDETDAVPGDPNYPKDGSILGRLLIAAESPAEPAPVDIDALVEGLKPHLEAAAEAAVRKVLGGLDGATPADG